MAGISFIRSEAYSAQDEGGTCDLQAPRTMSKMVVGGGSRARLATWSELRSHTPKR